MDTHFNIIVIGKGLIGSAAVKYLSGYIDRVAIIGPDEPSTYKDSIVFASHYDQTRIQRIIGKDEAWTRLNADSVKQYDSLQSLSGIRFHESVGCLYVNPAGKDPYLKNAETLSKQFNQNIKKYDSASEIANDFSEFSFPQGSEGILELSPAGYINPRQLLKAQLKVAVKNNAAIINETVMDVSFSVDKFNVKTKEGHDYTSNKILVAAGSFINFLNLIPQKLKLSVKSEVILLARVEKEIAEKLSRLPSLLYEINNEETQNVYLVQPVTYGEGAYYFKIGCNMPGDIYFENLEQIQEWFRVGDTTEFTPLLTKAIKNILPRLTFTEFMAKKCIVSYTTHGRPYIGETNQDGLFVAGGCNGYSAMCSDAIGSVVAELIFYGKMPDGYHKDSFKLQYAE